MTKEGCYVGMAERTIGMCHERKSRLVDERRDSESHE